MLFCFPDLNRILTVLIAVVLVFRALCRWRVFAKMGVRPWTALIPGVWQYQIYRKCWKARPFFLMLFLAAVSGLYVQITGYIDMDLPIPYYVKSRMTVFSIVCLMIITVAMYRRLAFAFGHDISYVMGLLFLNPIFMALIAFSGDTFHEEFAGIEGKEYVKYLKDHRSNAQKIVSAVSVVFVAAASAGYIASIMLTEQQPGLMVKRELNNVYEATSGKVSGRGEVIYPALDEGVVSDSSVRSLYYPDKSQNEETTVYMYIVGSNLEDSVGSASINLAQIREATAAGSHLRFVVEAGGSGRWFTDGFKYRRTARYLIEDGKVTLIETLPRGTSMSASGTLSNFLTWAGENYPSGRTMLFFWDHGGGMAGFGKDIISPREGSALMPLSELRAALKSSGLRYDLIAFDSCYMQTMEVGLALEPYADYLLASEEGEPGSGMYYTAAFSRLAEEPGLSTMKFGAMMCSSYDQSIELLNGGPQPGYTMSMTELRYLPEVADIFAGYLEDPGSTFRESKDGFLSLSGARSRAYEFQMPDQIDLLDLIDQSDLSDREKQDITNRVKRAILVRNDGSANHINGLAVYMPYNDLISYTDMNRQMEQLGMDRVVKVYNDFASIIGCQKIAKDENRTASPEYVKAQPWYVGDFEDYDTSLYIQDAALARSGDQYNIMLTGDEWETITGYTQGLKLKVGNRYADLGSDDIYGRDSAGHYAMKFDQTWVAINGVFVALHPGTPKIRGRTAVYTGTVDAVLNFTTPITIYMEWVNIGDLEGEGRVLGYLPADTDPFVEDGSAMQRGYKQFKANSVITFLYDWYDEDGNYKSTAIGHLPIRVGAAGLTVTQNDISSEDYICYGLLKDVANRTIRTKIVHHPASK